METAVPESLKAVFLNPHIKNVSVNYWYQLSNGTSGTGIWTLDVATKGTDESAKTSTQLTSPTRELQQHLESALKAAGFTRKSIWQDNERGGIDGGYEYVRE